MTNLPPTIEWVDGVVRIVDQRLLPTEVVLLDCIDLDALIEAIATLAVRGAPALGAAGAYGVVLAAGRAGDDADQVRHEARRLAEARPTAVNLQWGVDRALAAYETDGAAGALRAAHALAADDVAMNERIGQLGSQWLRARFGDRPLRMLTHCNAGHLATVGYGTAIGVIRTHASHGLVEHVWVDETRPLLQGARLTAWELGRLGICHRVIVDAAAASCMADGEVDVVIVGADRVAANGDVANKIGTYGLAVLAAHHGIAFMVAAPSSTLDAATPDGGAIVVETRPAHEVARIGDRLVLAEGSDVYNPAFDVTPAKLVTVLVTDSAATEPSRTNPA